MEFLLHIFQADSDLNNLFPNQKKKINYLTVFNEDEKPLIERMVFNHQGLKQIDANAYLYRNDIDSLKINML